MTPSYSARTVYKGENLKDFKIETYFQIRLILLTVQMHKHHMNYKRVDTGSQGLTLGHKV